ncbi:(R,R)-butanediol dehydrogenase/meso-butanediol dehydrogenase/diacetyl reductase [Halanaerobium congolense]|jgi:(R,R)-butanediol dehydrogenase/meso-butanediol dehydrogenase/diacetyl reductase|nr:2,3-butanediol dehydrogenase [Halanaerobium congolense]TDP26721.1 (R,R)-butanediol dehydrogenase/meso-butanediol dehydrogenase/diacetyl reductase [Halanaerobium congolense]
MKKTMKAARWYSKKDIRVEEIAIPEVKKGEVLIEVDWCGICGSDLHEYLTGPIFIPEDSEHPITNEKAPVVLGHEFAGTIKEIADGVDKFKIGDKVTVEPIVSCGECIYCKSGDYHLCDKLGFHGLAGGGGGLAEYTIFSADKVHKLPEGMSTKEGALIEPLAVASHSIRKAKFMQGETAAVLGAGPIGLSTILALKAAGAQTIIAVEIAEKRKEFAKEFGADLVLDPTEVDVVKEVYKYTSGIGVDASFETTGVEAGLKSAINIARRGGKIVVTSIWEKAVNINFNDIVLTEKELIGTIAYRNGVFPTVSSLIEDGRIVADKMITSEISLDDIEEKGFKELINNKNEHIKILVSPKK